MDITYIGLTDYLEIIDELNIYIKKTCKRWKLWQECIKNIPPYDILNSIKYGGTSLSDYVGESYYPYLHTLCQLQYPIDINYKLSYLDKKGYYDNTCRLQYFFNTPHSNIINIIKFDNFNQDIYKYKINEISFYLDKYTIPESFQYTFIPNLLQVIIKGKKEYNINVIQENILSSLYIEYFDNELKLSAIDLTGNICVIPLDNIDFLYYDLEYVKEVYPEEYTKYIKKQAQNLFI